MYYYYSPDNIIQGGQDRTQCLWKGASIHGLPERTIAEEAR